MKDCSLIIRAKNGVLQFDGDQIGIEGLAIIAGYLQILIGRESLKSGTEMEEIKNNLLDIHLAAIAVIEADDTS